MELLNMNWIYAHLIGDYIFQNDWMALHKKHSSFHCTVHVMTYIIPFIFCGMAWWQLLLIASQHFFQDRTNFVFWFMKTKGSEKFATGCFSPWSIVVVDNILHILWISIVVWIGGLI